MLNLISIDVQYSQKAIFSFEEGLNRQNHSPSGSLHKVIVDGMQLPQDYTEPLRGDSSLFTRNSWYLLNQSQKGESLR